MRRILSIAVLTSVMYATASNVLAEDVKAAVAHKEITPPIQVAAKIDGFLESHWSANKVTPAKRAEDATFLRRVTLDLTGRIPTTSELDRFLRDKSDNKRRELIDRLMNGPEFPLHFGNVLDQMIQT